MGQPNSSMNGGANLLG